MASCVRSKKQLSKRRFKTISGATCTAALESLSGKLAGFRRSQAKGVCASGYFVGNAAGCDLSSAAVFNGDKAPVSASYGSNNYWSTNAFEFVNAKNESHFVRWQFAPVGGATGLTDEQIKAVPDDFLADELRQRVAGTPAAFDFNVQLADKTDQLLEPIQVWPASCRVVSVGKLMMDKVEPAAGGVCESITSNPLELPNGVKPSADPVLLARAAPYAISPGQRLTEAAN